VSELSTFGGQFFQPHSGGARTGCSLILVVLRKPASFRKFLMQFANANCVRTVHQRWTVLSTPFWQSQNGGYL